MVGGSKMKVFSGLFKGRGKMFFTAGLLGLIIAGTMIILGNMDGNAQAQAQLHNDIQSQPQGGELKDIEDAVSRAILDQGKGYMRDEFEAEGHIILEIEQQRDKVKVYAIASIGYFGFENGIFTKVSGRGATPTVITLCRGTNGEFSLVDYINPEDGSGYGPSLKKMFPRRLLNKVKSAHEKYPELLRQQERQAKQYLKAIGRNAVVDGNHVEKKLANINVEASNKLFGEYAKYNAFINSCPYWLGTREIIEDGVRYIYMTSQGKTEDGHDLITFTKTTQEGRMVRQLKYKIVGSTPQLLEDTEQ